MPTRSALILAVAVLAGAALIAWPHRGPDETPRADAPMSSSDDAARPASGVELAGPSTDARVARLEQALREAQREIAALRSQRATNEGVYDSDAPPPGEGDTSERKHARVLELVSAYGSGTATRDEVRELLRLTKDPALMARVVGQLEARIAAHPDDIEARMRLAEVESARVHGAESITERAMLARNVRAQIEAVLERDPENWDARYMRAVGISHSQRSPQGRASAIREFESLIRLQQGRPSEARFADTYSQLAEVYVAEKDVDKARATLEAGLALHPDAKALREQLAALRR